MKMKLILFFVVSCLALNHGEGAPRTAVYSLVRCNPNGDQANCVTHQTPPMAWTPDLPNKLPAATAQYLEAKPVEEAPMMSGDVPEDGSGIYEGSATSSSADWASGKMFSGESGSGESWTEKEFKVMNGVKRIFPSKSMLGASKPGEQELREDHLLQQ